LFIDVGNRLGTEGKIIGEKNIVLADLRITVADAAQTDRAFFSRLDASELDGLVAAEPAGSKYSCSFPMVIFKQPTQAFFTAN
jgi:hypothetical protein